MSPGLISEQKWAELQSVIDRQSVKFSILYGSQSVGEATESSDIDIGLYFVPNVDAFTELFRIEEEYLEAGFDDSELDLTILNDSHKESFIQTVREQAVFLCGDEEAFEEFVS